MNEAAACQSTAIHPRLQRELEWQEHASTRRCLLNRILYDPPAFDNVVQAAFVFLDPQPGERVLDLGSGEGKETAQLAQLGANVVSVDLSYAHLFQARARLASLANARLDFVQTDAAHLPFAAGAFRLIYGKAILHHLNLNVAQREVHRILSPGGKVASAEPLARRVTPQWRSHDERPLTFEETVRFASAFTQRAWQHKFLTAPLAYPTCVVSDYFVLFTRGLSDWTIG